ELHDALHDLQHGLYEQIEGAVRGFQDQGDEARQDLIDYRLTLNETYIQRVRVVAGQGSAAVGEANEILGKLEQASEKLRTGIEQGARNELLAALRYLTMVLSIRPPLIDMALYQASKTLPLRALADALGVVAREIERLNLDPQKMGQFTSGIEALR